MTSTGTKKRERSFRTSPFSKTLEELFLLLSSLLGRLLGGGFLLSCHGESPPLQTARVAQNCVNKNLSLTKNYVFPLNASNVISQIREIFFARSSRKKRSARKFSREIFISAAPKSRARSPRPAINDRVLR